MTEATNPIPADIRGNDLMTLAWRDCLMWAVTEKQIMEAFRAETGCVWSAPKNGLEAMVDEATGVNDDRAPEVHRVVQRQRVGADSVMGSTCKFCRKSLPHNYVCNCPKAIAEQEEMWRRRNDPPEPAEREEEK
jgi:hypothetical protein